MISSSSRLFWSFISNSVSQILIVIDLYISAYSLKYFSHDTRVNFLFNKCVNQMVKKKKKKKKNKLSKVFNQRFKE